MRFTHLTSKDYVVSNWSGGRTIQIAIAPEGAVYADRDFLWRVSSATADLDESDYTPLPDYQRWLSVFDRPIRLQHDGGEVITLNPYGIHCFDRHPEHRLQYSEHIKTAELHKQRKHDRLRRDRNGEDHRRKQQPAPLKAEFGKAVSDRRADERLDHRVYQADQKRAKKGHPIIGIANDKRIIVQRRRPKSKFHRFIHQVALAEKDRGELGKQRKLDDNATPLSRIICASGHAPFETKRFSR